MDAVTIKNLSWKYEQSSGFLFENLNLSVPENTFLGIIGSNESGKTSLVSCIKGIIPNIETGIYKGEVSLFGKAVKDMDSDLIAQTAGMVFSDPDAQFTTMSVEEEIAFGLENIGVSVEEIRERIQWVSKLTHLENLLDKPPYDLSGGQKQRVAIAAVLATSMLDPKSKDEVFDILQQIKRELKMTIIVVEHNIEKIAELSDAVLLMNKGKIIRYEETRTFFSAVDLLKENGLKVPESIELIYYLYDKYGVDTTAPVKFNEIAAEIQRLLRLNEEAV